MHSFEVRGGKKLHGEIIPQGAKNEALQIISAVLLTPEKITITNIPDILDVNLLIELLGEMNVKIERPQRDTCIFQADDVNIDYLHSEALQKEKRKTSRFGDAGRAHAIHDSEKHLFQNPVVIKSEEEDWILISSVLKNSALHLIIMQKMVSFIWKLPI